VADDEMIDPAEFRRVLGHFPSGVTVVTAVVDGVPAAMTIQSFTSVSLDPPLVGFLPGRDSLSWQAMRGSGSFCVNILGAAQQELCMTMASRSEDKFEGIEWETGPTGSPVFPGSIAWIDCRVEAVHEAGDHDIVVGRVVHLEADEDGDDPLLFFKGGFGSIA
jgi:3-hydroxy-9,10-secoandrosta-1,3,5(10)-triene-9,17-dione monooxygenase reductase component